MTSTAARKTGTTNTTIESFDLHPVIDNCLDLATVIPPTTKNVAKCQIIRKMKATLRGMENQKQRIKNKRRRCKLKQIMVEANARMSDKNRAIDLPDTPERRSNQIFLFWKEKEQ
jgi:hypothetical protein